MARIASDASFVGPALDSSRQSSRISEPFGRLHCRTVVIEVHPALDISRRSRLNAIGLALPIICGYALFGCLATA